MAIGLVLMATYSNISCTDYVDELNSGIMPLEPAGLYCSCKETPLKWMYYNQWAPTLEPWYYSTISPFRNNGFPATEFNSWETDFTANPFISLSCEIANGLGKCTEASQGSELDTFERLSVERWAPSPGLCSALSVSRPFHKNASR